MTGLESIIDLSIIEKLREEEEKLRIVKILADPEGRDPGDQTGRVLNNSVNALLLRARANPQRHYEIYTIQTSPEITERDMWDLFNENPQYAADLIRERGNKVYSDRADKRVQLIE